MKQAIFVDQTRHSLRREQGTAFGQHQVHADAHLRAGFARAGDVGTGGCVVHHRTGGGDDAIGCRVNDAVRDAFSQTQVISIDDQFFQMDTPSKKNPEALAFRINSN